MPKDFIKDETGSSLKGEFYANKDGDVLYKNVKAGKQEPGNNNGDDDDDDIETIIEEFNDAKEELENEPEIPAENFQSENDFNTPEEFANECFEFIEDSNAPSEYHGVQGYYHYIGNAEFVEIPDSINGDELYDYYAMFENTSVKAVKADNPNIWNIAYMFANNTSNRLDLRQFNTEKIWDMSYMFYETNAKIINLTGFNTKEAGYMTCMFAGSQAPVLILTDFDTSNVVYMDSMFADSKATVIGFGESIADGYWDVSNVVDMNSMFMKSKVNRLFINSWNVSNVENMHSMFKDCNAKTIDIKDWYINRVDDMRWMFENTTIGTIDLSGWNMEYINNVNNASPSTGGTAWMFKNAKATKGWARTQNDANILNSSVDKPSKLIFTVQNEFNVNIPNYYAMGNDGDFSFYWGDFFPRCEYSGTIEYLILPNEVANNEIDSENWPTPWVWNENIKGVAHNNQNITSLFRMFDYMLELTEIELKYFDTSNVRIMSEMFSFCVSLTSLDLSNFDTSNVTYMGRMFYQCEKLVLLDISSFNTSRVIDMTELFSGCSSLTSLDLSNFDTSKVTDMQGIFTGCTNLKTLNLCNWNFRRVKEWGWMFEDCSSLQTIYVNSADAYAWLMLHRDEIELSSMVSIQYI